MKDLNDPSNKDTVPAMLTPGEFVMNKEATALFGPAIEAMNNQGLAQRGAENAAVKANMGGLMQYNMGGLVDFLKEKEGFKTKAYTDSAGVWTIGYGRTTNDDGSKITKGQTTDRKAEDTWIDKRAKKEWDSIGAFGKKHDYKWDDNQKAALASFRYNGGQGMVDMLTSNGTRDNDTILKKFAEYNKVTNPETGKKEFVQGLQNRRDAEIGLWGGGSGDTAAAETAAAETAVTEAAAPLAQEADSISELSLPDAGADSSLGGGIQDALTGALTPPPPVQAPPLPGKGQGPAYIPSAGAGGVSSQSPQVQTYSPQQPELDRNMGGAIPSMMAPPMPQYLGKGGRAGKNMVKVWDTDSQSYVWTARDQAPAQAAAPAPANPGQRAGGVAHNGVDTSVLQAPAAPMNFKEAANIKAQQRLGAQPAAPTVGPDGLPLPNAAEPQIPRFQQQGGALQGRIALSDPPAPDSVPQLDQEPPKPLPMKNTDEDLIQGSSQGLEQADGQTQSERTMRDLFDQQFGAGAYDRVDSGAEVPTDEMLEFEDKTFNQLEELDLTRKKGAVMADETEGQKFNQQLEQSQIAALTQTPVAPGYEGGAVPSPQMGSQDTSGSRAVQPVTAAGPYAQAGQMPGGVPQIDTNTPPPKAPEFVQEIPEMGAPPAPPELDSPVFADESTSAAQAANVPYADPLTQEAYKESKPYVDTSNAARPPAKPTSEPMDKTAQAETAMENINPGGDQGVVTGKSTEEMTAAGEAAEARSPGTLKQAQNTIKQAFGDLFDGKELVRMGVMFAGALATGATPGQALSFAGSQYIQRVDAKASIKQRYEQQLVTGGKFTPASIQAFSESDGDTGLLIPTKGGSIQELGTTKEFYGPGGQRIQAREVKVGENKVWLDGQNRPLNLNKVHDDPVRVAGTPEYNKRINDDSKFNSDHFKQMREQFGGELVDDAGNKVYKTGLTPHSVGRDSAKWAIENNADPQEMGQLLDNAYAEARLASKDGKKVNNITPYLNAQYIQANVGQVELFQNSDGNAVSPKWVNSLMSKATAIARDLPSLQGRPPAEISSLLLNEARNQWNALDPSLKEDYTKKAGEKESGFMKWFNDDLVAAAMTKIGA